MMKIVEIIGNNYRGQWRKTRTACRALIQQNGMLLLSHERATDIWMLPGGGMEPGESDRDCCVREVAEETGILSEPSFCFLEIREYYEDVLWVNRYFVCRATGSAERCLTEAETARGMEPRWLPYDKIREIFSRHAQYAGTDEERRGTYLREFTALCEWEKATAPDTAR